MKLSIIIPVYNVSTSLRRCVESVIDKQLVDYEIVLVDDGSTDGSADICDQLAQESTHIRVIHQTNRGLSGARNTGIKRSHSEYITFVDSDDFVESGTLSKMMNILKAHPEYDILEYSAVIAYGSSLQHRLNLTRREYDDPKSYWFGGEAYAHSYAWNKIFRRELFQNTRFPEDRVFEDVYTLPLLLKNAQTIATTSHGTYFYCYNNHGITATAGKKELSHLLEAHIKYISENTNESDWQTKGFAKYYSHVINIMLDAGTTQSHPNQYRDLLDISKSVPAINTKLLMLKLFGFKALEISNSLCHKIIPRKRF